MKRIPTPRFAAAAIAPFLGYVAGYEQKLLSQALAANHFNQRRAAALGLTYDQVRHYPEKHALNAHAARFVAAKYS
jgi:hypothetical protein